MWDAELGMVYYNWRYYDALAGCWGTRDKKLDLANLYCYCKNSIYSIDYNGLSAIIFTFFGEYESDRHDNIVNDVKEHNDRRTKWVAEVKSEFAKIEKQTILCRNGTEIFQWLREQGTQIFWNGNPFLESYEQFIALVENDFVHVKAEYLKYNQTTKDLLNSMTMQSKGYDRAVIVGHSRLTLDRNNAHFIIPRGNKGYEMVEHDYFGDRYTLITCYSNNTTLQRKLVFDRARGKIKIKLNYNSETKCYNLIKGEISYNTAIIEDDVLI